MAGIKPLRKIQMGLETIAGTAVAADTLWRGTGSVKDAREVVWPKEDVGFVAGLNRLYVPKYMAEITLDEIEATFEQLPIILSMGVDDTVSGAADGGGTGKVYAFEFPTSALATIKPWTIEAGDNQQAEEYDYCFCSKFSLSGKPGEAMMMSADIVGRQCTLTTYTAVSPTAVNEILFGQGVFAIDAIDGTPGGTPTVATLMGIEVKCKTGFGPLFTGDSGQLYFTLPTQTGFELTAEIKMLHNATAVAEIAAWRAKTPRLIRYKVEGPALTTAATYDQYTFILDMYGSWEEFTGLDDEDSNDVVTGTFRVRYDTTASKIGSITIVNQTAAL